MNLSDAIGLSTISPYAFYSSISSLAGNALVLPSSLTSIGEGAFAYNKYAYTQQLSSLKQDAHSLTAYSIKEIGPSAFMYNRFKSIELGNALSSIGDSAFAFPKYKFDIHLPSAISAGGLGHNAFKKNIILNPENIKANIVSVDVPAELLSTVLGIAPNGISPDFTAENVAGFTNGTVVSATYPTSMSNSFAIAYDGLMNFCPSNVSVNLQDHTFVKADPSSVVAIVPKYASNICPSAFMDCTSLVSVHSYSSDGLYSLQDVADYAFCNCYDLSNVALMSSTASIGECSFMGCKSISAFYYQD